MRPPVGPVVLAMLLAVALGAANLRGAETLVEVRADRVLHPLSRHLTGACIEDVNHEIYGGLYSQMIFGESFQEPAPAGLKGLQAFGGAWRVEGEELHYSGAPGDKLVSTTPRFADGEVGVEVFLPDRQASNVGLIVRVDRPGTGANHFAGYEIALNAAEQNVRLGRHRHNWEPIVDTPCEVPIAQWVALTVALEGPAIQVFVDGRRVVRHDDRDASLGAGTVGLRAFQSQARYRRLWVKTGGVRRELPFAPDPETPGAVSGMWRAVRRGSAVGAFELETKHPFVGRQSQRIALVSGQGRIGVENQGLNRWGMSFEHGKSYEATLWAKADTATNLTLALETADGEQTLAEARLAVRAGDWQQLHCTLTPGAAAFPGRLAILLDRPSAVTLGYVFLQPGPWGRFRDLPVRRDLVEGLLDQGITLLRYGGSMVNHPEYRWKKMIGPRDRRPPCPGTWYPHSTNGWGIVDFMNLCEAAGLEYIPAFNVDESPQDMADFVRYAKAPPDSEWGRRRAADGHPEPYRLRYLQLGNEERVDQAYFQKFQALAEAIWPEDPQVILVVGDFLYSQPVSDPGQVRGNPSGITTLAAHHDILRLVRQRGREVWFDLHVVTEGPRPDGTLRGTLSVVDALERLSEGARFKVAIFELNANNHAQRRALANALAIQALARDGRIAVVASANCLQPDGQNDNGWDQGLLFFNPQHAWLQPPGYVTRMLARNYLPQVVDCRVSGDGPALDALALRGAEGKSLLVQVVNPTDQPVTAALRVSSFAPPRPHADVTELAAPLSAVNTAAQPQRVAPRQTRWEHALGAGDARYTFAPRSITLLRWE